VFPAVCWVTDKGDCPLSGTATVLSLVDDRMSAAAEAAGFRFSHVSSFKFFNLKPETLKPETLSFLACLG